MVQSVIWHRQQTDGCDLWVRHSCFTLYKIPGTTPLIVPYQREAVTGLSTCSPRLIPSQSMLDLVMDKVALGQIFLHMSQALFWMITSLCVS